MRAAEFTATRVPAALASLILLSTPAGRAVAATWSPAGPWFGPANAIAYAAPIPGPPRGARATAGAAASILTTVYAGTDAAVYRSDDDGRTWAPRSSGLPVARVNALVAAPFTEGLVLAAVGAAGVHRSTDAGGSWQPGSGVSGTVLDLTAAGTGVFDETFYAGTESGVRRSTDGGSSWSAAGLSGLEIRAIAYQSVSATLFAAGPSGAVFRSTNGGGSWAPAAGGLGAANLYAFGVHPDSAGVIYGGGLGFVGDKDLYKTTDAGDGWQPIDHPSFPTFMLVNDIALNPADGSQVFIALLGHGVFRSDDGGGNWQSMSSGIGDLELQALAAHPEQPGALLAGSQRRAIYRTENAGGSWSESATGISGSKTLSIAVDEAAGRIWTGNRTGIVLSTDNGATWFYSDFEGDIGAQANVVTRDPLTPDRLYAGTSNAFFKGDVLGSTDGGSRWTITYSPSGGPVYDVVVDPTDARWVYAAFARDIIPGGVARSSNGGGSWSEIPLGDVAVLSLAIDPADVDRVLAGTDLGLQESLDRGLSFHVIAPELGGVAIRDVVFAAPAPESVYVATFGAGVHRSADGGASFEPASSGLGSLDVRQLAVGEAPGGHILYAATAAGAYRSEDHAGNWTEWNEDLLITDAEAVTHRGDAGSVLLGTDGAGMWARSDPATTGIGERAPAAPAALRLEAPRPNPTRFGATIGFRLAAPAAVHLDVFDVAGRHIRRLASGRRAGGRHLVRWDARDDAGRPVASGVYLVRLQMGPHRESRSLLIAR